MTKIQLSSHYHSTRFRIFHCFQRIDDSIDVDIDTIFFSFYCHVGVSLTPASHCIRNSFEIYFTHFVVFKKISYNNYNKNADKKYLICIFFIIKILH